MKHNWSKARGRFRLEKHQVDFYLFGVSFDREHFELCFGRTVFHLSWGW